MFNIEKRLIAIRESSGTVIVGGGNTEDPKAPWNPEDVHGDVNDIMVMEAALEMFMAESDIVGGDNFYESVSNATTIGQLLREVSEADIRKDVETKRNLFEKIKNGIKVWSTAPAFDPYTGLKELKAIDELIADDKSATLASMLPFMLGLPLIIINRAKKYKDFDKSTAQKYITQGNEHKAKLEKIASNLEKEEDKKYQKAAKRVRRNIADLERMLNEFKRRAIDKAVI